jgi:hypothetical protein
MKLAFTDYCLMRMRQRDVLEDEVRQAIDASASKHRARLDGRREVVERIGSKLLKVVYRRDGDLTIVINAMWED